jgi:hypothetical protein
VSADVERRRALVDVVGIDDEGLGKLARGAGELREHEHAAIVVARGDEFLRDEVHAVVEARDHRDVAPAVVLVHVVGSWCSMRSMIGRQSPLREAAVDALDHRRHVLVEALVLGMSEREGAAICTKVKRRSTRA